MDARVPGEGGLVAEALSAVGTGEGSLARVRALVHRQVRQVLEALAAGATGVRSLLGVAPLVHGEVGLLAETLAAGGARVGSLARVRPLVLVEVRRVGEGLAAGAAGVGTLARVKPLVCGEGGEVAETLAASAAGVGLHSRVGSLVGLQVGQPAKALATLAAGVWTVLPLHRWLPLHPGLLRAPGVLCQSGRTLGEGLWEGGGIPWDLSLVGPPLGSGPGCWDTLKGAGWVRGVLPLQNGRLRVSARHGGTCWGGGRRRCFMSWFSMEDTTLLLQPHHPRSPPAMAEMVQLPPLSETPNPSMDGHQAMPGEG